jgi:hypothetical protein
MEAFIRDNSSSPPDVLATLSSYPGEAKLTSEMANAFVALVGFPSNPTASEW